MNMHIKQITKEEKECANTLCVCMSFESERWKKYLETTQHKKIIIFYNQELINLYKDDISIYEEKANFSLIETSISNPILTADRYIEIVSTLTDDVVDIDCSTFTHEHLLILLKVFSHIKQHKKINIIYTSVNNYLIGKDGGWLSKGTKNIRNVLGFSGNLLPSKQLHLIVLVGLENERIQKIIEEYEPSKISIGKCSNESSLNEVTSELNQVHHNNIDKFIQNVIFNLADSKEFEFSCDSPEKTYEKLTEIISENEEFNNVIIAANSKISTIGVAKLAILDENVQVCYAQPIEYNIESYTEGCKESKYFEITL